MWKMSIQYTAPGFKLTNFWLRVLFLNHSTRAPALMLFAPVTPDEKEDISTKLLKLDQTKMIYSFIVHFETFKQKQLFVTILWLQISYFNSDEKNCFESNLNGAEAIKE